MVQWWCMRALVFSLFFALISSLLMMGTQDVFTIGALDHQAMHSSSTDMTDEAPSCMVHCFLEQAGGYYVDPVVLQVFVMVFAAVVWFFMARPLRLVLRWQTAHPRAYSDPLSLLTIMKKE